MALKLIEMANSDFIIIMNLYYICDTNGKKFQKSVAKRLSLCQDFVVNKCVLNIDNKMDSELKKMLIKNWIV